MGETFEQSVGCNCCRSYLPAPLLSRGIPNSLTQLWGTSHPSLELRLRARKASGRVRPEGENRAALGRAQGSQRIARLSNTTMPPDVRPEYDRGSLGLGAVHIGLGAFSRALIIPTFEAALRGGDLRWGVSGASLRNDRSHSALSPQDGLYSLTTHDGAAQHTRIVGALIEVLAPRDRASLVTRLASPQTHLATLTITEQGYFDDSGTQPGGVAAQVLADALALRRDRRLAPLSILSCDNITDNGRRAREAVLGVAQRRDDNLAAWIEDNVAFPCTMADRITPSPQPSDAASAEACLGVADHGGVVTEPYWQWVIENKFAGEHPDFAALGCDLVIAIGPWQDNKLRLLNAAHSAVAYLGSLAGHDRVSAVMKGAHYRAFVQQLMTEAQTGLDQRWGAADRTSYCAAIMRRFANERLAHETRQIAADGSIKVKLRLAPSLEARYEAGLSAPALTLAAAAWMRWQLGADDHGRPIPLDDRFMERTSKALMQRSPAEIVEALLTTRLFGDALPRSAAFRGAVVAALAFLLEHGAEAAVASISQGRDWALATK